MRVVFSDEARSDLICTGDYIAEGSPVRARSFVQQLRAKALQLRHMPHAFPFVPRYEHTGIRRRVFRDYPIFYRVGAETIFIVHIVHGAQDYEALLSPNAR